MYLWNASKLAGDLREGRVDEKERFKYYLATLAVLSIVVPVFFYSVEPLSIDDLIYLIVSAIIGVIGTILCYRANRSGDNIDFIPRMICLYWMGICGFLTLCIISLVIHLIATPHGLSSFLSHASDVPQHLRESWSWWGTFPFMPIWIALYYWIAYFYLVDVSRAKEGRILVEMVTTDLSLGKAALGVLMFPGSMFVFAVTESYITKHGGSEIIARLVGFSVAGLWLILLGWIFAVLHKRSMKRG
ncbi:MAG: hypothetical protein WBG50_29105 [Desulfomonilaceae bacterium]